MSEFQPGQIVKQNYGAVAHYAIVIAPDRTIGWINTSELEVKTCSLENWAVVTPKFPAYDDLETIKKNIKSFKDALEAGNARKYDPVEFNCEHWATLMVTGKSYSTQSGSFKIGTAEIVGGAMIGVGASAGTVVTIASTLGVAASTGTAISTLSGAAATNAALAWLGGGTIAAGGGGIAAGAAIVSVVSTGGTILAVVGAGIIGSKIWDNLNKEQKKSIINSTKKATDYTLNGLKQFGKQIANNFIE